MTRLLDDLPVALPFFPAGGTTLEPRRGRVRDHVRAFADDAGPFLALGASLFWGLWGYRHDRARLEANLEYLRDAGVTSVRVLGEVGGPYWQDRQIDPRWPDYDDVVRGFRDLAYDSYGIRSQFVCFGGPDFSTTRELRGAHIDRYARLCNERPEAVHYVEIGNESWQNGFPHPEGTAELRELLRRFKSQSSALAAITSPAGPEHYGRPPEEWDAGYRLTYEGAGADVGTYHLDRTYWEDGWRPVRQPWELPFPGMPELSSNDEPIGPGSSVAAEEDPIRLIVAAIVTYIAGVGQYTYHTFAGIWGGGVWEIGPDAGQPRLPASVFDHAASPTVAVGFRALRNYLPADLPNWSKQNGHWPDHPFANSIDGQFWPDGDPTGIVRDYGAIHGDRFVTCPFGIRGHYDVRARRAMEFDVITPLTGDVLRRVTLDAGQRHRLEGQEAFVLVGHFR